MRLTSFAVSGYKNFRQAVRLRDLGRINVIHGVNNAGKSNLLEAIGLLFGALGLLLVPGAEDPYERRRRREEPLEHGPTDASKPPVYVAARTVRGDALAVAGFAPDDIFNFETDDPIRLSAELAFPDGLPEDGATSAICSIELTRVGRSVQIHLTRLQLGEQLVSNLESQPSVGWSGARLLEYLTRWYPEGPEKQGAASHPGFGLIKVDRGMAYSEPISEAPQVRSQRDLVPGDVCLLLHDAKVNGDLSWQRFLTALEPFGDLLPGQPGVSYERHKGYALLDFKRSTGKPVPSHLLGTGTQQVLTLLGRLTMAGSPIMAIEEPECNLSYEMQHRLLAALRALIDDHQLPSQLFLTSHSNAFEEPAAGAFFYGLTLSPQGPQVTRRPASQAAAFTGLRPLVHPDPGTGPISYVTRDGLVRIPHNVLEFLGLTGGGGVLFDRDPDSGYARMLTNQQLLALLDQGDDKTAVPK